MMIETTKETVERKGWFISYVAVVFAMMTMQMSSLGFSPLLPAIKQDWGMSYSQMGLFTGIYGIVAMIMSIPAGLLAKRYGEKKVLGVGLSIVAMGLIAVSLAENYMEGLSARTFWIFGYRMAFISVMTAIALTAPSNWKGKAMGILGAMSAMASVIGAPFGTGISAAFGGWRHGMVGFGLMAALGVIVFMIFYKQTPMEITTAVGKDGKPASLFSAFKIPIVWTIPLLGLTNAAGFAATFFVPSVVMSVYGLDAKESSFIIGVAYAVAIVLNPICGWLGDKYNRWLVLGGMVALMIPACLLMTSSNIYVFTFATSLLVGLGLCSSNQVYPTAAELLKGRDTGPIMGIVALGGGIFGYLGPQALGWMRDYSGGFNFGWYVLTCTSTAILLLILYLKHYADKNNERLAAQGS